MTAIFEYEDDHFHRCEAVVEEVQIVNLTSPMPGYYTASLRAKVVTTSDNCQVVNVKGRVFKNGDVAVTADHELQQEVGHKSWWATNSSVLLSPVAPGDVIHATVDASWVCYGNVKDQPSPYYPVP